jgi:hypothetical protein
VFGAAIKRKIPGAGMVGGANRLMINPKHRPSQSPRGRTLQVIILIITLPQLWLIHRHFILSLNWNDPM